MLLDIDFKQYPDHLQKEPIEILQTVLGQNFGYVMRGSTTSNIFDPEGKPLENKKGCHVYVLVESGADIPETLKNIFDRLILAGYGFVFITTKGKGLIRTPVDKMVRGAQGVIYEADPVLPQGYTQNRLTKYIPGGMLEVTPLTEDEVQRVESMKEKLLADAKPECTRIKKEWCKKKGTTEKEAAEIESSGKLSSTFVLTDNNNSTFTVANVWHNPDFFHGKSIRDPLEPE